jgi:NAD(P)-dependent dehydrogenase (short-subunit alcohol dehydrogenase family)
LTDEAQVQRLIDGTVNEYGRIDILVNLAGGLTRYKPAVEHSVDDWRAEVGNNLLSAFLTSRAVFPSMQAGGGAIINFARAGLPQANMVAYNCAKAGIEANPYACTRGQGSRHSRERDCARACGHGVQRGCDEAEEVEWNSRLRACFHGAH